MTGSRLSTTSGAWRRLIVAVIVTAALVMTFGAPSTATASPTACRVRNTDTARTFESLQAAVDAARRGARLTVRGTCLGGTVIDKEIVVGGVQAPGSAQPTLAGAGRFRVMTVVRGSRVKLAGLVIRHGVARVRRWDVIWRRACTEAGPACGRARGAAVSARRWRRGSRPRCPAVGPTCGAMGGGIHNKGVLTLRDVVVSGNVAVGGGGVNNGGTLTLNGGTRIRGNSAHKWGGGISNHGTLRLNGASRINGNIAGVAGRHVGLGGGVMGHSGTVTMNGTSRVSRNSAGFGAGIYTQETLRLNDGSRISGNTAYYGGGAYNAGTNHPGASAAATWPSTTTAASRTTPPTPPAAGS